jgi:hypothetical protein
VPEQLLASHEALISMELVNNNNNNNNNNLLLLLLLFVISLLAELNSQGPITVSTNREQHKQI